MRRFLKPADAPELTPPKRARLDQDCALPTVAEQHAFLDKGKKRDWAGVRCALADSPRLINVQPLGRWSVLHHAADAGNIDVVSFLLERRGDVTLKTNDGRTPLNVASAEAVRALLNSVTSPSKCPADGVALLSTVHGTASVHGVPGAVGKESGAISSDDGDATVSGLPQTEAASTWQLHRALPESWEDMGKERQELLNDAKAAGIAKAMFREGDRSYIVDLEASTQTDCKTGNICRIRLHKPVSMSPASPQIDRKSDMAQGRSVAEEMPCAVLKSNEVDKTFGAEIIPGQTVEVPGSGAKPYIVKNCGDGVWSCTCVAWKMQGKKPTNQRSCKHIVSVRGSTAENERLANGSTMAENGTASAALATPPRKAPAVCPASSSKSDDQKVVPPLLLANKWEERVDPTGWWISEKLDGMRAFWDPDTGCLLSRLGNPISCPKPFLAGLPDVHLDGELFLGRGRFQELMSVVKNTANVGRLEGPWKDVVYVVFDMPKHAGKFEERMELLRTKLSVDLPAGAHSFAQYHAQHLCKSRIHLDEELKRVQSQDGEGLMLRRAGSLYEAGRSSTLLKVKTFQDEEAVVIGHEAGKGRNSAVTGALRCRNRAGVEFSVGTGLNDAQRANPPKVGEIITYRFFELTKDNKPRFPSFVGIRADADRKGLGL